MRARLGCIIGDRPAAVDVSGAPHFKSEPCLRCTLQNDQVLTTQSAPPRDYLQHHIHMADQAKSIQDALDEDHERWMRTSDGQAGRPYPSDRRDKTIHRASKNGGHMSPFILCPNLDLFKSTLFDPMHSLLEGACKTYFFSVLQAGLDSEKDKTKGITNTNVLHPIDVDLMRKYIDMVVVPSSIPHLHPQWGTKAAGTPTANEWRAFATVYGPLVMPRVFLDANHADAINVRRRFTADELGVSMQLCEIVSLAMRSSISSTQVDRLEFLIGEWQKEIFRLHPDLGRGLTLRSNLHVISHLAEDIRAYGPCYGWWTFFSERVNYLFKRTNKSGGWQDRAQVTALREVIRHRSVSQMRNTVWDSLDDHSQRDAETSERLRAVFASFTSESATDAMERVAFRYAEIDDSVFGEMNTHVSGHYHANLRGRKRSGDLPTAIRDLLGQFFEQAKMSYCLDATDGSTDVDQPYVNRRATFYERLEFRGRRVDASEWSVPFNTHISADLADDLVHASKNSLVSLKQEHHRMSLAMENTSGPCGLVAHIFQHSCTRGDGSQTPTQLYAVVRMLEPVTSSNAYRWWKW